MTPKNKITNIMGNYDKSDRIQLTPNHNTLAR